MEYPYNVGEEYIVIGNTCNHDAKIGSVVEVMEPKDANSFFYKKGTTPSRWYINMKDVKPVKKNSDDEMRMFFSTPTSTWTYDWTYGDLKDSVKTLPKTKKPLMKQLSSMMKRLLDADTQTLVKAGFINGDLELTDKGRAAMEDILFAANQPALVEAAQAVLDAEAAASK